MESMTMSMDDLIELAESHYTRDGTFGGFDCLGYVGNSQRNYVTDAWVLDAANELEWTMVELDEWMCSVWGRFALDSAPMSAVAMRDEMVKCDLDELLAEAVES